MKILIACERSGVIRDEFAKRGHNAMSCDLHPSDTKGKHYQGDVRDILYLNWDMIIAHPECTYICNSGVHHLHKDESRWTKLDEATEFFKLFINHPCKKVITENPIPHKYAVSRIGKQYDQIIHPWQFGHPERKATCLWLKGVPKLVETDNVKELMLSLPKKESNKMFYLSPGKDRSRLRSKTFTGIGEAMATQWG